MLIADVAKAKGRVQSDRSCIRRVADHRYHLPETALLRLGDEARHEQSADSGAVELRIDIDRILDAPAVRRARVIRAGIGVARHGARPLGNEIGIAVRHERVLPACHLGFLRRRDFERRGAVLDGVGVDAGNARDVARSGRPNVGIVHRREPRQKKTPRTNPGRCLVLRLLLSGGRP